MNDKKPRTGLELPIPEERDEPRAPFLSERELLEARRRWSADAFEEGVVEGRRREHDDHGDRSDTGWLMLIAGVLVALAMAGAYIFIYTLIVE